MCHPSETGLASECFTERTWHRTWNIVNAQKILAAIITNVKILEEMCSTPA